jgi:hypothetical protein
MLMLDERNAGHRYRGVDCPAVGIVDRISAGGKLARTGQFRSMDCASIVGRKGPIRGGRFHVPVVFAPSPRPVTAPRHLSLAVRHNAPRRLHAHDHIVAIDAQGALFG